ncbi:MAG: translation initiation factor IF-2 [Oscillospiraceae bacterium]|nr:translation initiation factor IF-2 [Oscillospiraceae bacterium]
MSTPKSTKLKINDVAKELNTTGQELSDFIKEKLDVTKKPTASLTEEEMNYVLEAFSQNNQVASFDDYFATKNQPKEEPKAEEKPAEKKSAKAKKEAVKKEAAPKADKATAEKPAEKTEKAAKAEKPKKETAKKDAAPKAEAKVEAKVEEKPKAEEPKKEQPAPKPVNNQPQNKNDRFNAQQVLNNDKKKKPEQKPANKPAEQSNKKKLDVKFADASVPVENNKIHTIDTRGSYVEMDKYNEKYDNMANASGGNNRKKDNFSKKQKLTQKSQQRKSQQYSNKRESEAEKLRRLELERARKQQLKVLIPDEIVVSELASRLKVTATEVIKKLMQLGEMCTINQVIDFDTASLVAEELGAKVEKEVIITIEERLIDDSDDDGEGEERAPVVVVMGHVDHGKTSLLDRIRNANVTSTEAGGITQHIGAYRVTCNGKDITFLDTPGHEAFTSMRARGASITDIAILVVAADDGIMPQTVEAINHAKAAGVSIIVAINKMDKEAANPDVIKQQLTEHGLVIEEWGGDIICVPVSAKTGMGIDDLLENVLLVAEVAELKANPNRLAKGTVVEARLDKGRGPIATILVQNGTLRTGDIIIAGTAVGRVRVMTNDKGKVVKEAGPSYPVEITGLAEVPSAGDTFNAVEDERLARELVEQRKHEAKQEQFKQYQKVTLDNLFSQIEQGEIKELPIIVKADVQGSVEAVKQSLEKLSNNEVRVRVIHGAVGAVSEGDVMLASASNAIIVGFNVRPDPVAADSAERDGVDIRLYRIIYDAIEEITTAMKGMLAPKYREVNLGRVEVRQVYKISNVGTVSGSYVLSGKITRNAEIRVVRDGIIIADDKMSSLKRFKDDVKEVAEGYECGITLEKFHDIREGDIFEAYFMEEYRPD